MFIELITFSFIITIIIISLTNNLEFIDKLHSYTNNVVTYIDTLTLLDLSVTFPPHLAQHLIEQ